MAEKLFDENGLKRARKAMMRWKERLPLCFDLAMAVIPAYRAKLAWKVTQQQRILRVMTVLRARPDGTRYSYDQVEAACEVSQIGTEAIYMDILTNEPTMGMQRFYVALTIAGTRE